MTLLAEYVRVQETVDCLTFVRFSTALVFLERLSHSRFGAFHLEPQFLMSKVLQCTISMETILRSKATGSFAKRYSLLPLVCALMQRYQHPEALCPMRLSEAPTSIHSELATFEAHCLLFKSRMSAPATHQSAPWMYPETLRHLWRSLSDAPLCLKGEHVFHSHRFILVSHSPWMFRRFADWSTGPILLEDLHPVGLQLVLQWMYDHFVVCVARDSEWQPQPMEVHLHPLHQNRIVLSLEQVFQMIQVASFFAMEELQHFLLFSLMRPKLIVSEWKRILAFALENTHIPLCTPIFHRVYCWALLSKRNDIDPILQTGALLEMEGLAASYNASGSWTEASDLYTLKQDLM